MTRWTLVRLPSVFAALLGPACGGGGGSDDDDGSSTSGDSGDTSAGPTSAAPTTDPTATPDTSVGPDDSSSSESGDTGEPATAFPGPTKGGAIAVSPAGDRLAVANRGTGELTLFSLPDLTELARLDVGLEPESVAFSPTGAEIYVVLRGTGEIAKVVGVDAEPTIEATVFVGAEPGRAALSATGSTLWVPLWAEGFVVQVDTATMVVEGATQTGGSPYAVCITNDLDLDEDDETVFVTDFYAVAAPGQREATDAARTGRVFAIGSDGAIEEITLAPLPSSGTAGFEATGAYPNQLYSCAINGDDLYVTSVGASPASFNGATDFHQNLQGLVHRFAVDTHEPRDAGPIDLNALVDDLAAPKRFVAIPIDIAFAPNSDFAYIASLASDSLLRVDFSVEPAVAGSPSGATFLATGQSPTGVAIAQTNAYVVNEVGRSISHIDLATQTTVEANLASATAPSGAAEEEVLRGQRFFNTGLGRWSANGWVSCAGCHPFGTTDNVTWSFPTGPRQTVDTSTSYDKTGLQQRVFNWTAIFDEVHDFELNTRTVAGGTGAIVSDTALNENGSANTAVRIDIVGGGGNDNPLNAFNLGSARGAALTGATPDDWDAIDAYVASIRAPHGSTRTEGDPDAGRDVFVAARCDACHGGNLWTISERYYSPAFNPGDGSDNDERLLTLLAAGIASFGEVRADQLPTTDPAELTVLANDPNGSPARHTCVSRMVGTFDADGPDGHGADEVRQNGNGAQGSEGFNVPSLLGMATGAPYLHNGAAQSLEELLDPGGDFTAHLRAGNQVFSPTDEELADLVAFVRSIDDDTLPFPIDVAQQICPDDVPQ
jgi:DNA-binding beta-propeller fold protein YncE